MWVGKIYLIGREKYKIIQLGPNIPISLNSLLFFFLSFINNYYFLYHLLIAIILYPILLNSSFIPHLIFYFYKLEIIDTRTFEFLLLEHFGTLAKRSTLNYCHTIDV